MTGNFSKAAFAGLLFASCGFLGGCGDRQDEAVSALQTVVGRGGAFWDRRVQFINAIPNPKDESLCLYLTEYNKKTAPHYDGSAPLSEDQLQFLEKAKKEARLLTEFPVSAAALDAELGRKENLRRVRGGFNNALGAMASFFGVSSLVLMFAVLTGPIAPGAFLGGMSALKALGTMFGFNILGAISYPLALGTAGGVGLLSQASRDLTPKNSGVRSEQAAKGLSSTNLNVTLAFANVAKTLPPVSSLACPRTMETGTVESYLNDVEAKSGAFQIEDFLQFELNTQLRKERSLGCSFTEKINGDTLYYQVTPQLFTTGRRAVSVAVHVLDQKGSQHLLGETLLPEQLSSDAGSGAKYAADTKLGSLAIWIDSNGSGIVPAKIAHKLPSGEFLGRVSQVKGTCNL